MLKMGSILVVAAGVVLAVSGGTAWAGAITGVTAYASGTANAPSDPSGNPYRVTDGSGFNEATGTVTAGGWQTQWVSNNVGSSTPADCWFKLDLASSYNLGTMKVWNGTDAYLNTYTQRRIFQGDIYVSNQASPGAVPTNNASGNGWTLVSADQTFHEATGVVSDSNISYSTPDIFDLSGNTARWAAIHIDQVGSNWQGWGYYAGIAEIRVFEGSAQANDIPEPATMALLGLAVTGLGGYVRRRRAASGLKDEGTDISSARKVKERTVHMSRINRTGLAVIAAVLAAVGVGQARAASLDLNFNLMAANGTTTYSNDGTFVGVGGGTSATWNVLGANSAGPYTYSTLKYADGAAATGVQVQYSAATSRGAAGWNRNNATLNLFDAHWHEGWGEGPCPVTVSGLTAPAYDMYVYAAAKDITGSQDTKFDVGGTSYYIMWSTSTGGNTDTFVLSDGDQIATAGENYLVFKGLTPTANAISFQFDDHLANGNGVFNAFQLVAVTQQQSDIPEPATMALLGLAVAGLGGYIRRRRPA